MIYRRMRYAVCGSKLRPSSGIVAAGKRDMARCATIRGTLYSGVLTHLVRCGSSLHAGPLEDRSKTMYEN